MSLVHVHSKESRGERVIVPVLVEEVWALGHEDKLNSAHPEQQLQLSGEMASPSSQEDFVIKLRSGTADHTLATRSCAKYSVVYLRSKFNLNKKRNNLRTYVPSTVLGP